MRTPRYYLLLSSFAFASCILALVSPAAGQVRECDYDRFRPFRVDHYPEAAVLRRVTPKYPSTAKRDDIQGVVTVKVLVSRDGKVARACMSKGHNVFQREAESAARKWRFRLDSLNIIRNQDQRREHFIELTIMFVFKQRTDSHDEET